MDGQTDGQTLPSTLSPSLVVDKNHGYAAFFLYYTCKNQSSRLNSVILNGMVDALGSSDFSRLRRFAFFSGAPVVIGGSRNQDLFK